MLMRSLHAASSPNWNSSANGEQLASLAHTESVRVAHAWSTVRLPPDELPAASEEVVVLPSSPQDAAARTVDRRVKTKRGRSIGVSLAGSTDPARIER